jgi:hypothetical protein
VACRLYRAWPAKRRLHSPMPLCRSAGWLWLIPADRVERGTLRLGDLLCRVTPLATTAHWPNRPGVLPAVAARQPRTRRPARQSRHRAVGLHRRCALANIRSAAARSVVRVDRSRRRPSTVVPSPVCTKALDCRACRCVPCPPWSLRLSFHRLPAFRFRPLGRSSS